YKRQVEKIEGKVVVTDSQAGVHSLEDVAADPKILAAVETAEMDLDDWLDRTLGRVEGDMAINDPMEARLVEHPYVCLLYTS
ncbi:hypothetical protein KQJ29_33045, partial [Enterococcus sp. S181_ASV_20]|nr:hypothetical protein [Enterococcus sp. S181_ASV_20]